MLARSAFKGVSSSVRSFSTTSSAANMARLSLIGRLGLQPEVKVDKNGKDVMIYSIATSERGAPTSDGGRAEPTTTWHRVLSYSPAGKDYLSTLPAGTLVHVEADFKKRVLKEEGDKYNEQTLLLMRNIEVISKPKPAETASA